MYWSLSSDQMVKVRLYDKLLLKISLVKHSSRTWFNVRVASPACNYWFTTNA